MCHNCKTKYSISDHLVTGRTFRMRCRHCNEAMIVRGPHNESRIINFPNTKAMEESTASFASQNKTKVLDLKKLGTIQSQSKDNSDIHLKPSNNLSTSKKFDQNTHVHRTNKSIEPHHITNKHTQVPLWHVAINDVAIGPVSLFEMESKIESGSLNEYSLVWREGFKDWVTIEKIPELLAFVKKHREIMLTVSTSSHHFPKHSQKKDMLWNDLEADSDLFSTMPKIWIEDKTENEQDNASTEIMSPSKPQKKKKNQWIPHNNYVHTSQHNLVRLGWITLLFVLLMTAIVYIVASFTQIPERWSHLFLFDRDNATQFALENKQHKENTKATFHTEATNENSTKAKQSNTDVKKLAKKNSKNHKSFFKKKAIHKKQPTKTTKKLKTKKETTKKSAGADQTKSSKNRSDSLANLEQSDQQRKKSAGADQTKSSKNRSDSPANLEQSDQQRKKPNKPDDQFNQQKIIDIFQSKSKQQLLKRCYDYASQSYNEKLPTQLKIHLKIGASGHITKIDIEENRNRKISQCIKQVIKKMEIPTFLSGR